MKNIIYICIGLSIVLMLCLFLPKVPKENRTINETELTVQDQYTVREFDGQIGIFNGNEKTPIEVFDTSVALLPKSDQELLEQGIIVSTPEELQRIIEDYTG